MAADFSGVKAKFARAEKHLHDFEVELGRYVHSNPLSLRAEPNGDGSREEVYVNLAPFPTEIGLVLGDSLHNARSALDHLVVSLAIANGNEPKQAGFPICTTEHNFDSRGRQKIASLSQPAQAFIEGLQPYKRVNGAAELVALQYLDNLDKHTAIIQPTAEPVAFFHPPAGVTITYVEPRRLVDGAHLATVEYPPTHDGVQVQPQFTVAVAVPRVEIDGKTPRGFYSAEYVARVLLPFVRDGVIGEAERLFG